VAPPQQFNPELGELGQLLDDRGDAQQRIGDRIRAELGGSCSGSPARERKLAATGLAGTVALVVTRASATASASLTRGGMNSTMTESMQRSASRAAIAVR
jgi:hypothetical protein